MNLGQDGLCLELFEKTVINTLNKQQQFAVKSTEGPLLVLAGAGTGKTKTLTTKIAYLMMNNFALPHQILAVTFTNKAANEMKERVSEMVGHSANGIWLGTFHSICAKILRQHAKIINLPSSFRIIDNEEQLKLINQIQKIKNIDEKLIPKKQILFFINRWKDKALLPSNITRSEYTSFYNYSQNVDPIVQVYSEYQKQLQIMGAVDFGDLILLTVELFKKNPDILNLYHNQFKYILVDEYQDVNIAQYLWLRLLSSKNMNICCVGDEDQSIYGWRGAEINNILRFEKDYQNTTVIRLEENYRSTKNILATASGLISHNKERLGKTLWTNNQVGEKVKIKNNYYSNDETSYIGKYIKNLILEEKISSTAVLVRSTYQMREFEEMFISYRIPYKVVGGPRFYERAEIKDAIAYLRLIQMPNDNLAFIRIINTPRRGIGNTSLQKIINYAHDLNISLFSSAKSLIETDELRGKAKQSLLEFINNVEDCCKNIPNFSTGEIASVILEKSGYFAMWKEEKSIESDDRVENLNEFIDSLKDFETIESFLEHISLVMDNSDPRETMSENVLLMTLHSSKGLEFSNVFLSGWSEGIFPNRRSIEDGSIEEERRLAYVGLTRAKKRSIVTYALNKMIHGSWEYLTPSRFINEMPQTNIEYLNSNNNHPQFNGNLYIGSDSLNKLYLGDRVFHSKFGYGIIKAVAGDKLSINFDHTGFKQVVSSFVDKV